MVYHWQYIKIPDSGYPTCHAANLAILPNGQLAVVYFSGASEGSADSVNLLQHLQADGTWSQPQVVTSEVGRSAGNAVLMPVPDGRTLLLYTFSYGWESVTCARAFTNYRVSDDSWLAFGFHGSVEKYGYIGGYPFRCGANWSLPTQPEVNTLIFHRSIADWPDPDCLYLAPHAHYSDGV